MSFPDFVDILPEKVDSLTCGVLTSFSKAVDSRAVSCEFCPN